MGSMAPSPFELVKALIAVASTEAGFEEPKYLLRRHREVYAAKFRDDAIYLARENTDLSYSQLAELFQRHHTSLIGAWRRAKLRRERNVPRRDGRTWIAWHEYLLEKAKAQCVSSTPDQA